MNGVQYPERRRVGETTRLALMGKKDKDKKKRPSGRKRKEQQTIGLKPEMWDALSKEAAAYGISRNQWVKVILSHRNLVEEEVKNGRIDPTL